MKEHAHTFWSRWWWWWWWWSAGGWFQAFCLNSVRIIQKKFQYNNRVIDVCKYREESLIFSIPFTLQKWDWMLNWQHLFRWILLHSTNSEQKFVQGSVNKLKFELVSKFSKLNLNFKSFSHVLFYCDSID